MMALCAFAPGVQAHSSAAVCSHHELTRCARYGAYKQHAKPELNPLALPRTACMAVPSLRLCIRNSMIALQAGCSLACQRIQACQQFLVSRQEVVNKGDPATQS